MNNVERQTLIFDCDGVIYPISDISLETFVGAVKQTAKEKNISEDEYNKASEKAIKANEKGLFNFVHNLCGKDEKKYNDFTDRMVEIIDYSKISKDEELYNLIKQTQKNYNVVVLTNNTTKHIDKVFERRFGKTSSDVGFDSYGIEFLKKNNKFYPKQTELGIKMFTKKLGLTPKDCILVEDTQKNLDVAKEIGISGVLIDNENTLKKYLYSLQNGNNIRIIKEKEH